MSNAKMVGFRVPSEIKSQIEAEALERGISQQELMQEMIQAKYDEQDGDSDIEQEESHEDDFHNDDNDDEYDVFDYYPPLLAKELKCIISESWIEANEKPSNTLLSDFLITIGETITEKAIQPRQYDCPENHSFDYREEFPEKTVLEIEEILETAHHEFEDSMNKELIFNTIAEFCFQRSDAIYNETRAVELVFTREEWAGLDTLLAQANKYRSKEGGAELNLEQVIRMKLGEQMEELGTGLFSPRDKVLYELGKRFQELEAA